MSGPGSALVRAAWTPGRGGPSHRSELVTQWLCGERLDVEEEGEDGWLRVRGPDGYTSWVDGGGVVRTDAADADRWEEEADRISLGTGLRPSGPGPTDDAASGSRQGPDAGETAEGPRGSGRGSDPGGTATPMPRFLPWGARAAPPEGDRTAADHAGRVRLPDGGIAEAADPDRLVAREEIVLRFPPRADALLATAASWIGVPYLWGGRTREGADCSGYVQAVLALHGRPLPRDSGQQATAGEPVWTAPASEEDEVDVLAVAREVLWGGDLLFFAGGGTADGDRAITHVPRAAGASGKREGFGKKAESIAHVAICAEGTGILHAAAGRGQVQRDDLAADDPLMERLRRRLVVVTRPLAREEGGRSEG